MESMNWFSESQTIDKMQREEHLKMFQCLIDTGGNVLRNLSEIRLLYNGRRSFCQFLEQEKHFFYHQYGRQTVCCECLPYYSPTHTTRKMDEHIFKQVYCFDAGRRIKDHFVSRGMYSKQTCIHAINPRNISLDALDLSALNYFLRTKGELSSKETSALQVIMQTRSRVCHLSSTTSIGLNEINNMWETLENALLDLSQTEWYKNMVKICIERYRGRKETSTEMILHRVSQMKEKDELARILARILTDKRDMVDKCCQTTQLTEEALVTTTNPNGGSKTKVRADEQLQGFAAKQADKKGMGCENVHLTEDELLTTNIPNAGSTKRADDVVKQLPVFGEKQAALLQS